MKQSKKEINQLQAALADLERYKNICNTETLVPVYDFLNAFAKSCKQKVFSISIQGCYIVLYYENTRFTLCNCGIYRCADLWYGTMAKLAFVVKQWLFNKGFKEIPQLFNSDFDVSAAAEEKYGNWYY